MEKEGLCEKINIWWLRLSNEEFTVFVYLWFDLSPPSKALKENASHQRGPFFVCFSTNNTLKQAKPGAHYPEPPSPISTLWVDPFQYLVIFRDSSRGSLHTTPFQHPMIPQLKPLLVTIKTEIPLSFCPLFCIFDLQKTRYFVGNQETLALITA